MTKNSEQQYLSVSELVSLLDLTLQEYVGELVFTGEINQVTYAQSGHVYFSLQDEDSKIDAVMWAGMARNLSFKLSAGVAVVCQARPNVYKRSGKLQMIASRIELFGEGLLQKKFNELKARLESEGLFDASRKRPLPFLPKSIGIVSSKDGAVIHDIMHRVQARLPSLTTYLYAARVQGQGAAQEVVAGIEYFNRLQKVDVIILARGGGSLEDLWAFNEEPLIRAIFASRIPIVSAIGHETDFTLTDFVADLRAPTPTAAAELVVPAYKDLTDRLQSFMLRLQAVDRWLQPCWQALDELAIRWQAAIKQQHTGWVLLLERLGARLQVLEPQIQLKVYKEKLLNLDQKLENIRIRTVESGLAKITAFEQRLRVLPLAQQIAFSRQQITLKDRRAQTALLNQLNLGRLRMQSAEDRLEAFNHIKLLKRGYAVVQHNGKLLKSINAVEIGAAIVVSISDGQIEATVDSKK